MLERMTTLQAVTGFLHVIDGVVQNTDDLPSGLLAQPAPRKVARGREDDTLLVHLVLSGGETAVLTQDLLTQLSQAYFANSGTVTSALRRAVNRVNEQLLHRNLSSNGASHEGAITCAVLRQTELFVVQIGEGLAYLGHNFGIERLPARSPDHLTPLGRTAGLELRYSHHHLQTGDMFLLADPRLGHLPTNSYQNALVDTEAEAGIVALQKVVESETAKLLLIEFTDEDPSYLPTVLSNRRTTTPDQPTLAVPRPRRDLAPVLAQGARQATSSAAMGLSRATAWTADILEKATPPEREEPTEPNAWVLPTLVSVLIPIIVAVIVTSVFLQRGEVERFNQIQAGMQENMGLAEQAEDPNVQRQYYEAVLALADEADTIRERDADTIRVRKEAVAELDLLNGITRLGGKLLYEYVEGSMLTAVALRPGFNGDIYTLDSANNITYKHPTDDSYLNLTQATPEQLTFTGRALGNYIVDDVVDLMWRPAGTAVSRDGLAMIDQRADGGAIITYYPDFGDLRAIPLDFASEWGDVVQVTDFSERLYLLDVETGVIWKYFPSEDTFIFREDEPTLSIPEADFANATDMAIYSEDGSLAVTYADGRVRYYDTRSGRVQWDETTLLENGLQDPIVRPVAVKLVGEGLNASVFIADAGTSRIIEVGRGGIVLSQFRALDENGEEIFTNLTDFDVAEAPLRIFVTVDNRLYVAMQ